MYITMLRKYKAKVRHWNEIAPMGFSVAGGKLIHEKTWSRKSRASLPFTFLVYYERDVLCTFVIYLFSLIAFWDSCGTRYILLHVIFFLVLQKLFLHNFFFTFRILFVQVGDQITYLYKWQIYIRTSKLEKDEMLKKDENLPSSKQDTVQHKNCLK